MLKAIKNNKTIKEYFNSDTKAFWIIILSFILLITIPYAAYLYLSDHGSNHSDSQKTHDVKVTLSQEDSNTINSLVKNFIKADGTWGLNLNKVNNNNLPDIQTKLQTQSIEFSNDIFTTRDVQYKMIRDKYIQPYSSIYYNDVTIANNWEQDKYSIMNMASFNVYNIVASNATTGVYVNGDKNNLSVNVPVSFVDSIKNIQPTGSDELWDGTFYLYEKKYTNSGTISLIKTNGEWKVQDLSGLSFQYPLVTFSSFDDGNYYGHLNDDKQQQLKLFVTKLGIHPSFS